MLFDLRGRGRRRTVQVIYLSLAILMGGGLVLFGIGGATSGGLFDAFNGNGGSGSGRATPRQRSSAPRRRRRPRTVADPKDAAAWARLVSTLPARGRERELRRQRDLFTAAGKKRLVPVEQRVGPLRRARAEPARRHRCAAHGAGVRADGPGQARQGGPRARDDHRRARRSRRTPPPGEPLHAARRATPTRRGRCARATSPPTGRCRWRRRASASSCARLDNAKAQAAQEQAPSRRRHRSRRRRARPSTTG